MRLTRIVGGGGGALLALASAVHAQELPVRVSVYAEHRGGNVVYRYEVRNNGPGELRWFYIGCDCPLSDPGRTAELQVIPSGAQPNAADASGVHIDTPAGAATQPSGWRVQLLRPHGGHAHWLAWRMPAARANAGVAAGRTLSGFSIALPQADRAYLEGTYSAHVLHNGRYVVVTAPLTLLDTTPPTLSLKTAPARASADTSTARVRATATDDRDPEPRVVVESLVRAEGPGSAERRYTVTYSATDASGNRATASTIVTLPAAPETPAVPPPAPVQAPMVQARAGLPPASFLP